MNTVFIGGSRFLNRVNAEIAKRLDNIIFRQLRVIVGDANGFDKAAQSYLATHEYPLVTVYCTAGECRNNMGDWSIHAVDYIGNDHGRAFYTAKDDAMLADADYGLFAWDGKSKGTLRNIRLMAERGKPSVVYFSPLKQFVTIRHPDDLMLMSHSSSKATSEVATDLFAASA
jgi:hypothetical protein